MSKKIHISNRRWILIPIETKFRELEAKVLLSCVAAERGYGSLIGAKSVIRGKQHLLPKGIFIEKSISPGRIETINKAKLNGNKVSAWCEEGLIYWGMDDYHQRRLELESFDAIEYFFSWGHNQASDICTVFGKSDEKIVISGNPRFDLLRPEIRGIFDKKVKTILSKYANIILINTKFGFLNLNREDMTGLEQKKAAGKIRSKEQEILMERAYAMQNKVFTNFFQMIINVSNAFPNYTIVIRPHPSESHAPYNELKRQLLNVKVIFEGNANEWILASEVMIHYNCTTGVEAFLLGKPSISYRPYKDDAVEHALPNKVSYEASNDEEVIELINKIISKSEDLISERQKQLEFASKYIANIDGPLASDTIMDAIEKVELPVSGADFPLNTSIAESVKEQLRRYLPYKLTSSTENYTNQKFPGLELYEVEGIVKELQRVTGRFNDVEVVKIDRDSFCLYKP